MKVKAHAKINICLNVVCRRDDGYHELEMIMVPLMLHDELTITLSSEDCYTCSDAQLRMDETNTIVQAVELMRRTFSLSECFHVHVEKRIPAQAGLAGGSADAAAVMRGIRDLLKLDISLEELAQLGKQVGADVPFCIMETCALVKPAMGVPTGKAFSMLDFEKCDHPDCNEVIHALQQGDLAQLSSVISNSLEYSAFQLVPEIADIKHQLQSIGFEAVLMSGSGSTVFAITRKKELLRQAEKRFHNKTYFVCCTAIKQ